MERRLIFLRQKQLLQVPLTSESKIGDTPQQYRFGGTRPYSNVKEDEVFFRGPHRILTANNPNEPGLDNIMTFPVKPQRIRYGAKAHNVGGKVAVFAFQYKFSVPGSSTTIGNDDIASSFINSIRNNFAVFNRAIQESLFGYVFVSATPCCGNVDTKAAGECIRQKLAGLFDDPVNKAILAALSHIAILKRDDVLKFIPRSFRSRPQFRLERSFQNSVSH